MRSLGLDLLDNEEMKDFELTVYDGDLRVSVAVHRVVLKTCSPFFARALNGSYLFFYVWCVPRGAIATAMRLIKFFYTRNLRDLGDLAQTAELCLALECVDTYNLVKQMRHREKDVAKATKRATRSDGVHTRAQKAKRRRVL